MPATAPEELAAIEFVGTALAPFFLNDPRAANAQASFDAMAALDPAAAAAEWPFVDAAAAQSALEAMVAGLSNGCDDSDLLAEYRRLFVGPAPKPAPPWGSVYTDRECVVFGLTTLELRRWMREHRIARTTDEHTPEDHIGLMLALMAHIARTQPDALDDYLQTQLLTWSSHFLTQLEEASEHPFYRGLAQLTRLSLEGIQRARSLKVDYPRYYR